MYQTSLRPDWSLTGGFITLYTHVIQGTQGEPTSIKSNDPAYPGERGPEEDNWWVSLSETGSEVEFNIYISAAKGAAANSLPPFISDQFNRALEKEWGMTDSIDNYNFEGISYGTQDLQTDAYRGTHGEGKGQGMVNWHFSRRGQGHCAIP